MCCVCSNAVFFLTGRVSFLRLARHRQIAEPELIAECSEDSDEGTWHQEREESSEDEEEEEEVDDEVSSLKMILFNLSINCWEMETSSVSCFVYQASTKNECTY